MASEDLTHAAKMRAIKALRKAEKHYFSLGYDPVESVTMIYRRALEFYDKTFPNDEADFRSWILARQEKSARVAVELLRREEAERKREEESYYGPNSECGVVGDIPMGE